jgi:hypothetical protein
MFDDLYHKQHVQIANNVAPSRHLTSPLYIKQKGFVCCPIVVRG